MDITALHVAGVLAAMAALGHGWLGDQTMRVALAASDGPTNFIRSCYQFGAAGWLAGAFLLLASNSFEPDGLRVVAFALVPMYAFGSLVNLWFTKGRHPGWVMLASVAALIAVGGF